MTTRQLTENCIESCKLKGEFPSLDYYEERLLGCSGSDSIGSLTERCCELLEIARRNDPTYLVESERLRHYNAIMKEQDHRPVVMRRGVAPTWTLYDGDGQSVHTFHARGTHSELHRIAGKWADANGYYLSSYSDADDRDG